METFDKQLQYRIFGRDNFRCVYCENSVPEVVLDAVTESGNEDQEGIDGYITVCDKCFDLFFADGEKGNHELPQTTDTPGEQADMMIRWHRESQDSKNKCLRYAIEHFETRAECDLSDRGRKIMEKLIDMYPFKLILVSIEAACSQYLVPEEDGYNHESINKAFNYVEKICYVKSSAKDKPYLKDLFYVRGILKNRFSYVDLVESMRLLEDAYKTGYSIDTLKRIAKECTCWSNWRLSMEELLDG